MAVCFSPIGRKLVSGGEDSMLWIWNMKAKRIEVERLNKLNC
jgi:WD40 repeat protein